MKLAAFILNKSHTNLLESKIIKNENGTRWLSSITILKWKGRTWNRLPKINYLEKKRTLFLSGFVYDWIIMAFFDSVMETWSLT